MTDLAVEAFRKASEIDGETDPYLHSILRVSSRLGLTEDAERERQIIDKISEETAKMYEEWLKQLEEAQQTAESDDSSEDAEETAEQSGEPSSGSEQSEEQ